MTQVDWILAIPTVSEANINQHWAIKNKRKQLQKKILIVKWKVDKPKIKLPCTVKLIRIATRKLDEEDNLRMAFKTIKDCIADLINPGLAPGQADGNPLIKWDYGQEFGPIRKVRIIID